MKVFLTGITGLLGNNIARALEERGDEVVALVRGMPQPEVLGGMRAKCVIGDLESRDVIGNAVRSCDAVIHSAAIIHLGWTKTDESMRINRDGTSTIADAAREHGKRMVHIGTVNTLALATHGAPSDEETLITDQNRQVQCDYVVSKTASVAAVLERVPSGLDAVVVHPGFLLGPYDWKPSSGRLVLELSKFYNPVWPTGGCSVCDVRDVASGVLAALDRGKRGRQYALAGTNVTYRTLVDEIAIRVGRAKPILPLGPLNRRLVELVTRALTALQGKEPTINGASLKMSSQLHWHSSDRARRELGYTSRVLAVTLDDAVEWIQTHFINRR